MGFDAKKNAQRFIGFADNYNDARPSMPEYVTKVIIRYLGHMPDLVVDLGCGTGLSTLVWHGRCGRVVGIEPSEDMLKIALKKATDTVSFINAYANHTTLPDEKADVVVCSQSFHWMEPTETLREVNRLLKQGGIFAAVDCDWPPVCGWEAEIAYNELMRKTDEWSDNHPQETYKWDKARHLSNMKQSGYFRYCREIVFCNRENGDAQRLINLAKSQGGLQAVLRQDPDGIIDSIRQFEKTIESIAQDSFPLDFCYRLRIGIK